jgi:ribosomal protein S18 acetylase RimI-like enzyme
MSGPAGRDSSGDARLRESPGPKDVQDVRDLVARTGVFSEAEVAIAAELVEEALRRGSVAGYEFVFAEGEGCLAGYTCFGPIPATAGSYDLYWIAVHPDHHGRGLGRTLLARSEARIAEAGGSQVWVDTSSRREYAPAWRLYRAAGYREAARLEGFYGPDDAKLIFAKSLVDPSEALRPDAKR